MIVLPPANYHDRVATLLSELGVGQVTRTEISSTCYADGPCEVHPDRGERCKNARGVSYYVEAGFLKGVWNAWGDNAEESVFNMMVTKLDDAWWENHRTNSSIAQALRNVGK